MKYSPVAATRNKFSAVVDIGEYKTLSEVDMGPIKSIMHNLKILSCKGFNDASLPSHRWTDY